jgi:hypothetical protein
LVGGDLLQNVTSKGNIRVGYVSEVFNDILRKELIDAGQMFKDDVLAEMSGREAYIFHSAIVSFADTAVKRLMRKCRGKHSATITTASVAEMSREDMLTTATVMDCVDKVSGMETCLLQMEQNDLQDIEERKAKKLDTAQKKPPAKRQRVSAA